MNNQAHKTLRRALRQQPITCERILWSKLRNRRLGGYKFRRQHSIGNYIVDFCSLEIKLIIEVDGATHSTAKELSNDKLREGYFKAQGLYIKRFYNNDVKNNINDVLNDILKTCNDLKKNI